MLNYLRAKLYSMDTAYIKTSKKRIGFGQSEDKDKDKEKED